MTLQVGREIVRNYLNNYAAFVAFLKKSNMSSTEILSALNESIISFPQYDTTDSAADIINDEAVEAANNYVNSMPALKVFLYCLYVFIFVVGIGGNVLVCYVVLRNKNMHTVTNLFITNLALSDILLCTFAVPFTPLYLLTFRSWVFGRLLCHLLTYAQGVSVYISAFTLMSIAIDRFFVIIYPFKPRMEIKICLIIVVCIWVSAALLTLPYGLFVEIISQGDTIYCQEVWPYEESRKAFGFSTSVLQFVIPFIIITFCYMRVCCKLQDRARTKPGAKSARKEEMERERTRRTNRMLISMVVIFCFSWLPLNINNLVQDFYIDASTWLYQRAFFFLAHAVAMSSCCYNPFLYAWLNENFRKEFKQVLPCFRANMGATPTARRVNSAAKQEQPCKGPETHESPAQRNSVKELIAMTDVAPGSPQVAPTVTPQITADSTTGPTTTAAAAQLNPAQESKETAVRYVSATDSVKLHLDSATSPETV